MNDPRSTLMKYVDNKDAVHSIKTHAQSIKLAPFHNQDVISESYNLLMLVEQFRAPASKMYVWLLMQYCLDNARSGVLRPVFI